MKDDIRDEVAVVTGASRGLGLLLARELARQGCPLVICARDRAELERAATRVGNDGARVIAVACDITDEASPRLLIDTAVEHYGRLALPRKAFDRLTAWGQIAAARFNERRAASG